MQLDLKKVKIVALHAGRGFEGHPFVGQGWPTNPLDHWAKAQSELASVFDKNGKGVRWPPLAIEGVANEPPPSMQSEYTKFKQSE